MYAGGGATTTTPGKPTPKPIDQSWACALEANEVLTAPSPITAVNVASARIVSTSTSVSSRNSTVSPGLATDVFHCPARVDSMCLPR
jgi:hypothetical protein